jgi:PAS domain S-box-containing protein
MTFAQNGKKKVGQARKKADARHRAQESPSLSQDMYRVLFSTMREAFVLHKAVLDENGNPSDFQFIEANPAFERQTGLKRNDIVGKRVSEVFPADQAAIIVNAGKQALSQSIRFEQYASDLGRCFDVHAFSPKKGMFATISIDVTDEKSTKRELQEANEVLRGLVGASPIGIVAMDLEGKIKTWSRAAERMFGWREDEIIGHYNPTVPDNAREEFESLRQRVLNGEVLTNIEIRRQKRDGSVIDVSLSSAALFDTNGRAVGIIVLYMDITDRKKLEDQLRQSQKMEAVGRLAGGVAHDFNNLLTIILGECDLNLETLEPDDPILSSLEEIRKAGERAALLTAQLLMFSRKQLFELTTFSLNEIMNGMSSMFQRLLGEDVGVKLRPAPDLGLVTADRGQIEQVLVNLVVNARDAMPQGGTIIIESANVALDEDYAATHPEVRAGEYVMLAVSDTGTGMSDEVKKHLFEPFFTTKEQGKGTGLGLATSYGIVRQVGGHLAVYSEVGTGTTMRVYLPLTAAAGASVESRSDQAIARGDETILLVEDEARVRAIATRMLSTLGYTVLAAADGEDALRLLGEHTGEIHLLLTDVVLPKIGGRELAELVRAMRPRIKVLFTSGYTDDVILQHRLLQHDIALVNKPYTTESLSRKVREALSQESSAGRQIIRVLIVDDEPSFCTMLKKRLELLGEYEAEFCTDAAEALNQAKQFEPDVILLDVTMPGLSGPEVAEQLQEDPATKDIPFIYLTGLVAREEVSRSNNLIGGNYFVAKPVELPDITRVIAGVLALRS